MELKDMTNNDLMQYCKDEGIEVEAKNVSKPTKKELLTAIKKFEQSQFGDNVDDFLAADEKVIEAEKLARETKPKNQKLTRAQKRKKQYNELMPLKRVLITSNADNQTKTNLEFITWGNGLIGHHTDRVYLGKPWHVREGALRNMRRAMITRSVQNEDENKIDFETVPAYNIQELDPLSESEIELIAKRQTIRNASIESLI